MSREALVLLVCCCDFRDGAEWLIPSKSLRNAVIWAFPGLLCILRMCAPRRAAAVVRPRGREKSADRRRRILISRLLIIRASVPRWKSPFPAYFKGFPAVSPLIPPYPAFLKYPVSPQQRLPDQQPAVRGHCCVHRRPLCRRAYGFYPLASVLGFDHRRRRKAHLQSSKRGVPVRPPAPPQSERQAEASGRRIFRNAADAHRPQRQKGFRDLQAGQRRPQAVLQDPQQPGLPAVQAHGPRLCHRAGTGSERNPRSHSPRGLCPQPQQQVRRDHRVFHQPAELQHLRDQRGAVRL